MRPIAIFRHSPTEGPGYFATYLERCGLPWELVRIDMDDPVPARLDAYAGLALMGGPMSVNDPLPWIAKVLALIREAVQTRMPVIGHCLGGQLMSKALGGIVTANSVKEIGWAEVSVEPGAAAQRWLGTDVERFLSFHWHGETFSIPDGAQRILSSRHCTNQAYVLDCHVAMQCHVEMTAELIASWCHTGAAEIAASPGPAVQSPEEIQRDLCARLAAMHAIADRIYARWVEGLCA